MIQRLGPTTPPSDPHRASSSGTLGQTLQTYAELLSHPNPSNPRDLEAIARTTVELRESAKSVMHAASPVLRTAASDLENLLQSPLSVKGITSTVSILTASEHYLKNPATAELGPLVQELCHNVYALERMRNELSLLSKEITEV